ncbi:hypothetical protein RB195_014258 [Necator americanus]|uniref:Tetraspanin family protein n=1 Tax=Necator americanus TaxID=51031 RepID=A0ABR1DZC3_NECAM
MFLRGRTLLLTLIVIQLCLQYSVLYEAVRSLNGPASFTIFDSDYPYLFDILLVVLLVPSMLFNIILFVYGLKKHTKRKKRFVVMVFAFNWIFAIPFFISGIYLYLSAITPYASKLGREVNDAFVVVLTGANSSEVPEKSLNTVLLVQNAFCCCGLRSKEEWRTSSVYQDSLNGSLLSNGTTFFCPTSTHHENGECKIDNLEGCAERITRIKRFFILLASGICLCCCVTAMTISPFIYASFEYDRRLARAAHIRAWRMNLEFELDKERRDDFEEELAPVNKTPIAEESDVLPQPTQRSSKVLSELLVEYDDNVNEEKTSKRSITLTTDLSSNGSSPERLLPEESKVPDTPVSVYADKSLLG